MLVEYKMENKLIATSSTLCNSGICKSDVAAVGKMELVPLVVKDVVLCLVRYATSLVCS